MNSSDEFDIGYCPISEVAEGKNRDTLDKSTKFGMEVPKLIQNGFRRGAHKYLCYFQNGGHFSKWPPPKI